MPRLPYISIQAFAVLALSLSASAQQNKEPVDYVDPNIGGIGQLLSATSPNVIMPYGMMRISPITTPGITDRYLADKIYGFPAGGMTLMPMTGSTETDPAKSASMYDHDLETATPYYYAAILEKHDIRGNHDSPDRAVVSVFGNPFPNPSSIGNWFASRCWSFARRRT